MWACNTIKPGVHWIAQTETTLSESQAKGNFPLYIIRKSSHWFWSNQLLTCLDTRRWWIDLQTEVALFRFMWQQLCILERSSPQIGPKQLMQMNQVDVRISILSICHLTQANSEDKTWNTVRIAFDCQFQAWYWLPFVQVNQLSSKAIKALSSSYVHLKISWCWQVGLSVEFEGCSQDLPECRILNAAVATSNSLRTAAPQVGGPPRAFSFYTSYKPFVNLRLWYRLILISPWGYCDSGIDTKFPCIQSRPFLVWLSGHDFSSQEYLTQYVQCTLRSPNNHVKHIV